MRTWGGAWSKIRRGEVADGLTERIISPHKINQSTASLCGPASLLYSLARSNPVKYAKFGIDLYERGQANLGTLCVKPGSDCRNYRPPGRMPKRRELAALQGLTQDRNVF